MNSIGCPSCGANIEFELSTKSVICDDVFVCASFRDLSFNPTETAGKIYKHKTKYK